MKKYIIGAALLLILAIIVIYTNPRSITREYEGFIYGYEDVLIEGHVKVALNGTLYPKIFGDDIFNGQIRINDEKIDISSPYPGNFKIALQGIKNKLSRNPFFTISSFTEGNGLKTQGIFQISRDFGYIMGYTDKLREEYNSKYAVIVCPASNREEAKKILGNTEIWGI